jgi:hypothetical protein
MTADLYQHRTQVALYGQKVLRACGIELGKVTQLQRQICGAFLFGIVYAYGRSQRLTPPEVHALGITMLQDVLGYSATQAGAFSSRLIAASSAGPNDTMNAIIHRGIDGQHLLATSKHPELRTILLDIFCQLNAAPLPDNEKPQDGASGFPE